MSIILKDIDLPKEGEILGLRIRADGTAFSILRDAKTEVVLKLNDTQAIQIDRPHGRLIDGDKLRDEFSRTESGYCGGWEFCDKPEDFQFLIDDEPTILEAEE